MLIVSKCNLLNLTKSISVCRAKKIPPSPRMWQQKACAKERKPSPSHTLLKCNSINSLVPQTSSCYDRKPEKPVPTSCTHGNWVGNLDVGLIRRASLTCWNLKIVGRWTIHFHLQMRTLGLAFGLDQNRTTYKHNLHSCYIICEHLWWSCQKLGQHY